jgi:lipopolysaccharide/colanic/teichoic acid biosynthesis glycosyltransferase
MKRFTDIILSTIILIILSPLLIALYLVIKFNMGKPVFFTQQRIGVSGTIFSIIKFRTMVEPSFSEGQLLDDNSRITKLGKFLRSYSLDELPELLNVLRGEMSLVGPRPLLADYLPKYTTDQARRHNVLPGITGLAQINGRNLLSWEEKFRYDVLYVANHNLFLDFLILFKTLFLVLTRKGILHKNSEIMPYFDGTENS